MATNKNELVAINEKGLKVKWRIPLAASPSGTLELFENYLVLHCKNSICCYDLKGTLKWKKEIVGKPVSSLVYNAKQKVVITASEEGFVYALDIKTGNEKWFYPELQKISKLSIVKNKLFISGKRLSVFELE